MSAQFEFYPALGLAVWVAPHAVRNVAVADADADADPDPDTGSSWIPGIVTGVPLDIVGQWAVRFGPTGAQRTDRFSWSALAPRTSSSPAPMLAGRDLSINPAPLGNGLVNSAESSATALNQSGLNATRATYRRNQFEQNAARHWDLFYRSNTVNFFKDRHWLDREFPEIGKRPKSMRSTPRASQPPSLWPARKRSTGLVAYVE